MTTMAATGFCPHCYRQLSNLMRDGRGFCEEHGIVAAEWNRPPAAAVVLDNAGTTVTVGSEVECGRWSATIVRVTSPDENGGPTVHVLFDDGEIDRFRAYQTEHDGPWVTDDVEVVR